MGKENQTKELLIHELEELRQQVAELKSSEAKDKQAEQLRMEEDLIRSMMENLFWGITVIDTDYRIRMANKAVGRYFNKAASELVGRKCFEELEKRESICPHCPGNRAVVTGKPEVAETEGVRDDGSHFSVRIQAFPTADSDGAVTGFIEIVEEITERKQAEKALRKSEEKYRSLVESTEDSVYLVDKDGTYLFMNNHYLSRLSCPMDKAIGVPYGKFHSEEKTEEFVEKLNEVCKTARSLRYEHKSERGGHYFLRTLSPVTDQNGQISAVTVISKDITKLKHAEEQLAHTATRDPLTGLPNRQAFNDRLCLELSHAHRDQQKLAVMMLDLDHFKDVNDTLGHSVGDQLLQAVGDRLKSVVRKSDTVARLGGDEFMLILPQIAQTNAAEKIAQKLLEAVREPLVIDDHKLHVTTSIGVVVYPEGAEDVETLVKNADIAMYRAKSKGRDNYQRYTPAVDAKASD